MAIQTTFQMNDEDETFVAQSIIDCVPRIGEIIWFVPPGKHAPCKVVDVAHWISIDAGNNYQAACVFLEKI